jgi:hypothetical protein
MKGAEGHLQLGVITPIPTQKTELKMPLFGGGLMAQYNYAPGRDLPLEFFVGLSGVRYMNLTTQYPITRGLSLAGLEPVDLFITQRMQQYHTWLGMRLQTNYEVLNLYAGVQGGYMITRYEVDIEDRNKIVNPVFVQDGMANRSFESLTFGLITGIQIEKENQQLFLEVNYINGGLLGSPDFNRPSAWHYEIPEGFYANRVDENREILPVTPKFVVAPMRYWTVKAGVRIFLFSRRLVKR